jgi:type IV pilus assembly protein PilQ
MTCMSAAPAFSVTQSGTDAVVVSALKVQSESPSVNRLVLESTSRLDYNVLKPEPRLVSIDLYGVDTSRLQAAYAVNSGLIQGVQVKSGLAGRAASRIEITLSKVCEIRTYATGAANALFIEFTESASTSASLPASAPTSAPASEPPAPKAAAVPVSTKPAVKPVAVKAVAPPPTEGVSSVKSVTVKRGPEDTVATIAASGDLKYSHFLLHGPERLVLNLENARNLVAKRTVEVGSPMVKQVRVGNPDANTTRVVFDLNGEAKYEVSEAGGKLTVRIAESRPAEVAKAAETEAPATQTPKMIAAAPVSQPETNAKPVVKEQPEPKAVKSVATETPAATEEARSVKPQVQPASLTVPAARTESGSGSNASRRRRSQAGGAQFGDPNFQGDPISLDITGIDLSDILRFVSDNYDVNFVLDKSVQKVPVTIKVNQVPWTQVIESIFRANQLAYRREGMIVRVATVEALTKEEQAKRLQKLEEILNSPTITEYFKIKYERIDANSVQQQTATTTTTGRAAEQGLGGSFAGIGLVGIIQQTLSASGRIAINPRTNTLIITDIPSFLERARDLITKLDVPEPQVEIEARIVFASRNFARDIGVQLFTGVLSRRGRGAVFSTSPGTFLDTSAPGNGGSGSSGGIAPDTFLIGPVAAGGIGGGGSSVLSLTTGPIGTAFLSSAITANEQKGVAKSIASPRVTVQNNQTARIVSGTKIPFVTATAVGNGVAQTVTFQEANTSLEIIPQITSEGTIMLTITVTNDAPSQAINGFTSVNTRTAQTRVLVPDGGTTIIGGVMNDQESNTVFRTPGISSLPLLGNLFKRRELSRTTGELLFFITPRIYRGENLTTGGEPVNPAPATTTGGQP